MFRPLWFFLVAWFRQYILGRTPRLVHGEGYKRTRAQRRAARTAREWRREFYLQRAVEKRIRKGIARLHHWYTMGRTPLDVAR